MAAAVFLNIIVHPTWITQSSKHMFLLTVTSVYSELTSLHIVIILLVPFFFLQVHKFHHIVWLCPWCVFFMVLFCHCKVGLTRHWSVSLQCAQYIGCIFTVRSIYCLYLYSALNILFLSLQCAQYIGEIARYLYATPECPEEKMWAFVKNTNTNIMGGYTNRNKQFKAPQLLKV